MYAIDINGRVQGNHDVFTEMLAWLNDSVGPTISEDQRTVVINEDRSTRTYKIEGTGWYYEYSGLRISVEDDSEFEPPEFFHYASDKAGGSTLYTCKVMYIEDIYAAVEFKLKW
jgi:hypothetical protein